MTTTIDDEADRYLRALAASWITPERGECLVCYTQRMLLDFGCDDTLRFAVHYRDARASRATSLEQTLGSRGGYCDCKVLLNVYVPARPLHLPVLPADDDNLDDVDVGAGPQSAVRSCETVNRGSTQPCSRWRKLRRGGW